jgi:hypothetical protein
MIFIFLTVRVFPYIDVFWNCKDLFADHGTIRTVQFALCLILCCFLRPFYFVLRRNF